MALTSEEVLNYRYSKPEPATETSKEKPKGSLFDPVASFGAGAGGLVAGVGTFVAGSDSTLAELGYNAQDYWNEQKSERLKSEEGELSRKIAAGDWSGAGSDVLTSPFLAANMLAGSAPAMAAGMGVGGIIARGMAGAGAMTNAAGQLTRAGGAVASGIGEGAFIATDVYEATKGDLASAGVAGVLLGVGVSAATPGSVGAGFARKVAGTADDGLTAASQAITGGTAALAREGAGYAAARAGRTGAQEFGQEFVQEGGQALLEQYGKGEELNLKSALASATVGGILGMQTGIALHPVTGEGSKLAELQDAVQAKARIESLGQAVDPAAEEQRQQALRIAEARVDVLGTELSVIEKRGQATTGEKLAVDAAHAREEAARNPGDPLAVAKANMLTLNSQVADIPVDQRSELQQQALYVAGAELLAAQHPDNTDRKAEADTARAALLQLQSSPDTIQEGTNKAARIAQEAILAAPTLDTSLLNFERAQDASAVGRIAVRGLTNTAAGVALAEAQIASETYDQNSEAQKREEKEIAEAEKNRIKAQQDAVKQETQAVKLEQAKTKLQQERAKLGLPAINADLVQEATGSTEAAGTPARQYTIAPSPDGQTVDVVDHNGDIYDTYRGPAAVQDATAARDRMNEQLAQPGFQTPPTRDQALAATAAPSTWNGWRTRTTIGDAELRLREIGRQNGRTDEQITRTIRGFMQAAENNSIESLDRDIQELEDANAHSEAELLRALVDEREAENALSGSSERDGQGGTNSRLDELAQAMRDAGYSALAVEDVEDSTQAQLFEIMNDITAKPSKRRYARELADQHGYLPITEEGFNEREAALVRALGGIAQIVSPQTLERIPTQLAGYTDAQLINMANGYTPSGGSALVTHANEQKAAARVGLAFKRGTTMASTDGVLATARARLAAAPAPAPTPAATPAPAAAPPAPRRRAEIVREYESALEDWADQMSATVAVARRHVEGLSDQRVTEGLADPDVAPYMLPIAEYRGLPIPANLRLGTAPAAVGQPQIRRVEADFDRRARAALSNGVLAKLGAFWTSVMNGRGQRVFNINTRDLANVADGFANLTQEHLDELRERYNNELNRQARQWAADNNQVITTLINPIDALVKSGSDVIMRVRSLGRQGQNPYMVPANDTAVGSASIAGRDGHMTTVGLASAKGSSNLAYRLGAEIGRMAGRPIPASGSLLTNNRMRRHIQSVYADSLFGPGQVSPMGTAGQETQQGVPRQIWTAANEQEKIGLNLLRAAHQGTENRSDDTPTVAAFLENLSYNSRGEIVATTDPKHRRGWTKGTIVTDAELVRKLLELDTDYHSAGSDEYIEHRPGNSGNRGATAAGRTPGGGVGPDTAKLIIMTNTILNKIENNPDATIPATWVTQAKKVGRQIGGWMFSEAEQAGAKGISADDAIARVNAMVGENAAKLLLESGMIDFVQSGRELTGETFSDANGKVQGATTPDGKIILVLNNLSDKTFDAVLSHEAIHATLKNVLGDETYNNLMSRLDTMLKAGEGAQWVKDANARVPAGTSEQDRLEEIAGYAVELHVRGGTRGNPLVQWAKDFMSALRTAIIQNKSLPEWLRTWATDSVQPADLTRLAMAGLKRAAAKTEADLKPNPKATSINVGLTVGMGETAEVLTPEFVRAEIEKLGVKVGRSNVVDASYEHQGETVQENTFVAELDRALTPAEVERLAINTKQQAIPQRVDGVGGLYGPKAQEWGGFSAHEFRELNGQRSDAENRESRWRDWDAEIKALMEEHKDPKTTNARRSKINEELRSARMFQRADREVRYQNATGQLFSVGASYGTPREGAVSVVGVHFGNNQRNVLNSVAYGKGIKGEEAARLVGQNDIRPRTMFYVDEGKGVTKEPGLGSVGKQVQLNNLYDLREDALGLGAENADMNEMERVIMKAGFDGYYRPNYRDMGQGVVVMVGKHDIPVEPYVPGQGAAPAPTYTGNAYAEALAKSKLPGGSMLGREWSVAINGTEFDTPPVRAALEQRQDQRIYRDDLPRFNRGLRYSMAEEHQAIDSPVADALPNELNILDLARRSGVERALEKMRAAIQDKHVTLRRIQQLAGIVSENVGLDTIGALERLGSKLMAEQRRLVDAPLAKIEKILNGAGYAAEEARSTLDKLLIARHAPEYNDHTATINPAKYDSAGKYLGGHDAKHPGSGITDAQANETVRLLTSGNTPKVKALLEAEAVYRRMISELQDFAVDRGLEKQETIDNWNKKFPFYTPFNRELNLEENNSIGSAPGSAGFSLRSGIARRAMGSGADIISPLASTALWGLKTTQRGENAIVSRTFLEFANFVTPNYIAANGEKKPMWVTEKIPTQRVIKRVHVYLVPKADGSMSPEFYNREQARAYADMQQAMWEQKNPDADPETSGIEVQRPYDEPQNRVVIQPTPNYLNEPNVMVIPVEGENVIITFDDKSKDAMAILNAFKNKAGSGDAARTINKMLTIPRMFSRWIMATATGYNPVFMVFNAARDIQASALNAGADKIPGWTPKDSTDIATKWMKGAKEILVQLEHEFKQLHENGYTAPPPAPDSMGEWMDRMVAAGGATGITHSIVDVESAETQMRRLFGQDLLNKAKPIGSPDDMLTKLNEGVAKVGDAFYRFGQGETKLKFMSGLSKHIVARTGRLNEAAELTTRTLVFKRATELYVQAGKDVATAEKLAANISKNISTNFNRRGNWTNIVNQLFPFFNAAANGTARLAETLFEKGTYTKQIQVPNKETGEIETVIVTDQNTKLTPYGKKVAGALGSIGILQAALLLAAGFDDDDIPENIKERAFIVPIPFSTDRDYLAIPMPHGFNLLVNAGRNLTDASVHLATGEYGKAAKSIGVGTFGQLGALNPTGSAGNFATDMLPAIADPIISLYMNKDTFGRQIAKEDLNPANPTPGFTRAKEGASKTARVLSEGLNRISGGNEDQRGLLSPTPDQIDFVIGTLGGGVGREVSKAASATKAGFDIAVGNEREVMPSHKMPLIGRLYGNADEPSSLRAKLFTVRTEVNETYARYKGLKERGDKEAAAAFREEHPEITLRDDIERYARENAKQTKARALARDEGEIGKVNAITSKSDNKVADLLRKYNELK